MDLLTVAAEKEAGLLARLQQYVQAMNDDSNEAQTRFHVIDELLIAELDWKSDAIKVEPYIAGSGYADYALFNSLRCRVVLEAKRDSLELCSSTQDEMAVVPLSSSSLRGAREGIDQAIRYAARFGAPVGIVTNGRQWIAFLASRADGVAPVDGLAVVFPSIDAVTQSWSRFYEFLSDYGLQEQRLSTFLRSREIDASPVPVRYFTALDRSYKRLPQASALTHALEDLFRKSFIKISNTSLDVLIDCFVETKASRDADVGFEKIVDELLDRSVKRFEKLDTTQPEALQDLLEASVELRDGEFVLVVGNKGSGKSTFLQRFFRRVLPRATRERVLLLSIDLLRSEGADEGLTEWMSRDLIKQAERELFGKQAPTFDQLRGAFWSRYLRLKRGEYAPLYKSDPDAFRQKFGEDLRDFQRTQPRDFLLALMQHAILGRKLLPVLVIDNVDHLPRATQDRVFQYAIGISTSVASFIICPVTDTTVWSLTKAGPLQSFHSRAFFLPVPSLKEVFARRLDVLKADVEASGSDSKNLTALVGKGMKLSINDISSFCATVESMFVASTEVTSLIGRLANYDVRRSLELSGAILSSPWVGLESLLKIYLTKGEVRPKRTDLITALVLQRGTLFDEDKHSFLANVFARPPASAASPLMSLYMLRHLMTIDEHANSTRDRFVSVSELWSVFSSLNMPRETFRYCIDRLFSRALVESYDPSEKLLADETLIRVSAAGAAHYRLTFSDTVYVSQMSLVTQLESEAVTNQIREEAQKERVGWMKLCRVLLTEVLAEDARLVAVPDGPAFSAMQSVRQDIRVLLDQVSRRAEPVRAKQSRPKVEKKHPRSRGRMV